MQSELGGIYIGTAVTNADSVCGVGGVCGGDIEIGTAGQRDVTIGNIQASSKGDCLFGYPAATGWDAATGFGTMKFPAFVECAKRNQDVVRSKGLEFLPDGSYRSFTSSRPTVSAPVPMSLAALLSLTVLASIIGA